MVRLLSNPGGQVVADEEAKDGEDGGGGHGGEDEFVLGRLLHAPIIT